MAVTTDRDKVRLKVGDTDSSDPLLNDDEIDSLLDDEGNVIRAAIAACKAIAAKFARGYKFSTDGQTFDRQQRVGHYLTLAKTLQAEAGVSTVATTRTDGYSDSIDYQETEGETEGRVRQGYFHPDIPA